MQRKYLLLLLGITGLYALALFLTPVDKAVLDKYNLSIDQVRVLYVFIVLPLFAIWSMAFYGLSVFDKYAHLIRRDKDGAGFQLIARGLMILVVGSAATNLINALLKLATHSNLPAVKAQVVIGNYLTMLVTVASFAFMYRGAVQLCGLTRKPPSPAGKLSFNMGYLGIAALYACLFMSHLPQARAVPLTTASHAAYYAPTWLLIPTVLIPYLLAWYLGGLTVYLLGFYTRYIGGSLYSHALRYLSYGIAVVVAGSVAVQLLTVFAGQLQNLSTATILLLIYTLLAIITAGYVPIVIGAKKLAKIETA